MTGHYLRRGAADETGRKTARYQQIKQMLIRRAAGRREHRDSVGGDPPAGLWTLTSEGRSKTRLNPVSSRCFTVPFSAERGAERWFSVQSKHDINIHSSDAVLSWTLEQIMAIAPIFERRQSERQSEERPLWVPVHQQERDPCFYCWNSWRAFCQKGQVKVALLWPELVILNPVKGRFKPVSPWEHIWLPVVIQLGCLPSPSYLLQKAHRLESDQLTVGFTDSAGFCSSRTWWLHHCRPSTSQIAIYIYNHGVINLVTLSNTVKMNRNGPLLLKCWCKKGGQSTQTTVFLQYMLRNNLEVINLSISTFSCFIVILYHCWDAQTNPIFSWICHIHTAIFWLDVAISGKCAPFLPTSLLNQIVRALVLCHLDNRLGGLGICFQRATRWVANCTKSGS